MNELKRATEDVVRKYSELLSAVERKHHNESRHETALRYIKQCEEPTHNAAKGGRK